MARDDFALKTEDTLAHRVGMCRSNPNCRRPTIGPDGKAVEKINERSRHFNFARGGPLNNSEKGESATMFPSLSYMARCRISDCVAKRAIEANAACLPVDKPLQPPSGRAPRANCPHPFSALVVTETTLSRG